ncbi:MAG: restriction endonuclease subunit S [Anaerorhabdus sp.]
MKNDDLGKIPSIRFKGFTNAWEQRKLGDYIIPYNEVTTKNNQYPVFTSSRKGLFFQTDYYDGNQIASEDNTGYNIVPRGYFTYRHMSDDLVFKFNINNLADNGIVSTLYPVFTTTESLDPKYLQYQLNEGEEFKRFAILQKQGGSRTYMYLSKLKDMILTMPILDEQIKISTFFTNLDNLITLHQRKLDKTKELKKTMLSKMFPKNGEDKPELRFSGFTDAWELRRLSELFSRGGSGGTPRSTNKSYYNGKIPFLGISDISSSNGFIDKTEKYITEEGLNNSSAWIVPAGSISLAMYASVGKLAILNTDVATSQAFYNMVFDDDNLRNYIYQRLSKANESGEWTKLISTGTQANLNADKVKNFDISIPTNKGEMSMISNFFMDLDNLITLHQRELEQLKNIKKTLLKHMFV